MHNVLTDGLPYDYRGYQMNTDFETGILIMQVLHDTELSEFEQQCTAVRLLFDGYSIPEDVETAVSAVAWFLTGWNNDNHSSGAKDEAIVMDMGIDQWRIYSAFRAQYRVNLLEDELHFWEYMALLTTLEECAFTRVIDIREKKESKGMSLEEKKALRQAKKIYAIKEESTKSKILTKAEKEFLAYAKGK